MTEEFQINLTSYTRPNTLPSCGWTGFEPFLDLVCFCANFVVQISVSTSAGVGSVDRSRGQLRDNNTGREPSQSALCHLWPLG